MVEEGREKKSWWQKQVHDYKQQKSWVWRPVYTVHTMWFPFFCMGCFMLFWGIVLLTWQGDYNEIEWDYTDCCNQTMNGNNSYSVPCDDKNVECPDWSSDGQCEKDPDLKLKTCRKSCKVCTGNCTCYKELNITPEENDKYKWDRDVLLYYGLDNFHQNHRQYADSRDDNQLDGKRLNDGLPDLPSSDCEAPHHSDNSSTLPIMPCGSIANSLFNDTVKFYFFNPDEKNSDEDPEDWQTPKQKNWQEISLLKTNIAMPMDKKRFNNPDNIDKVKDLEGNISRPIGWTKDLWDLDPDNEGNNGLENEDLIVWMRAAPTGSFRKLWRKVDHDNDSHIELKDGLLTSLQYRVEVDYNYDVSGFGGRKKVIITRANYLGSKNAMRGYVVIAAAIFYFFFSALFWVIARKENNLQRKGSKDN